MWVIACAIDVRFDSVEISRSAHSNLKPTDKHHNNSHLHPPDDADGREPVARGRGALDLRVRRQLAIGVWGGLISRCR